MAPQILKVEIQTSLHLLVNGLGDADRSRVGQPFEPRRDVETVTEDLLALDLHVAQMHPHPELHPPIRGKLCVPRPCRSLDLNRALHGVRHAAELRHDVVASEVDEPSAVLAKQ